MNRRAFLNNAGVLSVAAVVLGLYGGPVNAADPQPVTVLVTYHSATGNTEKMARGVAEGAKAVPGTSVLLKRVGEVAADDLSSSDAVIVGSPVYLANMSGEVKTFLDNWLLKFDLWRDRKIRNNQMIVVSGGGGFGASATAGPDSPGIDEKELAEARDFGKRVAEVTAAVKRGSGK
jgi:NAD(P)H dehydrogenase (quinone)